MSELWAWGKQFSASLILLKIFPDTKDYTACLKQKKKKADKLQIMRKKKGIKHTVNYKL